MQRAAQANRLTRTGLAYGPRPLARTACRHFAWSSDALDLAPRPALRSLSLSLSSPFSRLRPSHAPSHTPSFTSLSSQAAMRLTPVLLVAGAGALGASASAHPQPLDVSPAHAHSLEARSPLSLSIGGLNLCIGLFCNRPSRSWKCSGASLPSLLPPLASSTDSLAHRRLRARRLLGRLQR